MTIHRLLKLLLKIAGVIVLFILIYFLSAFLLSSMTVNSRFTQCEKDAVEVYILTNGIHTDIVCPVRNEYKDWSAFVSPSDTKSGDTLAKNVAFGWGDKGFYIETKHWEDLKFSTAFKAVFFLSSSAMHVTFLRDIKESESCRKICVSEENYMKLVDYVEKSFEKDPKGNPVQIKGESYQSNDSFYEALRTYNLFFTCNTWANRVLIESDMKACFWTPFSSGIFNKYEK